MIAAPNLKRFYQIKKKIFSNKNIKEVIYWPILPKEEGYWMSAFSKTEALQRIINELKQNTHPLTVMWVAELPTLTKSLFYSQFFKILKNNKIINDFIKNSQKYNIKIITSEYPLEKNMFKPLLKLFAVKFSPKLNYDKIDIAYTSMIKIKDKIKFVEKHIISGKECMDKRFKLGLGVISPGVLENEPTLTPAELDRDLSLAKKHNIDEVYIFRLAGLNKEYLKIITQYT